MEEGKSNMFSIFLLKIPAPSGKSFLRVAQLQKLIFNKLSKHNYSDKTKWIDESEILELQAPLKKSIYILPTFDGQCFAHLEKLGCRIYGSDFFLHTLNTDTTLPSKFHPVFSLLLQNAVVSFTGISYDEREARAKLIQYMGGRVLRQFDRSVTHLLADTCDSESEKYRATARMKIPVLSPNWVDDLWNALADGDDISEHKYAELFKQHNLPIFKGCIISISGFDADEIIKIGELIELHGGVYSQELSTSKCTHLIVSRNAGPKFHSALKRGIKIVDLKWLRKSIEMMHRLEEGKFSRVEQNPEISNIITLSPEVVCQPSTEVAACSSKAAANVNGKEKIQDLSSNQTEDFDNSTQSNPNLSKLIDAAEKENIELESEVVTKRTLTVFDIVEKSAKEIKEQEEKRNSLSQSNSSVILDKRQRTSLAGTIRTTRRQTFANSTVGSLMLNRSTTAMPSPAKLPTEEMDASEKDRSVMEWVEDSMKQQQQEYFNNNGVLSDATNLQKRKIAKPKISISTPLGDMVVNMHQQLLENNFLLKATEFKKEILSVIDKYETMMLEEAKK